MKQDRLASGAAAARTLSLVSGCAMAGDGYGYAEMQAAAEAATR